MIACVSVTENENANESESYNSSKSESGEESESEATSDRMPALGGVSHELTCTTHTHLLIILEQKQA